MRFDPKKGELDLQAIFEQYLKMIYGGQVEKGSAQYTELRNCWFAVAQLTQQYMLDCADMTLETAEMRLEAFANHIEENIEGIKAEIVERAKAQAKAQGNTVAEEILDKVYADMKDNSAKQ